MLRMSQSGVAQSGRKSFFSRAIIYNVYKFKAGAQGFVKYRHDSPDRAIFGTIVSMPIIPNIRIMYCTIVCMCDI